MKRTNILIAFLITLSLFALSVSAQAPSGACCTGFCIVLTEATCAGTGGAYQGDGTTCDPDPCVTSSPTPVPTPTPTPTSSPRASPTPTPTATPTSTPTATPTSTPTPTATSSPSEFCGNGIVEEGEECDDGNTANSDGCSATCELEPDFFDFLFGANIASNLLHNKLLFMLHIVKEEMVQLELKQLEIEIASKPCEDAIFSLRMIKTNYRYAKEEEFDALVNKLILIFKDNPAKYPIEGNLAVAEQLIMKAEELSENGEFDDAVACKCKAYKELKGEEDDIDCDVPDLPATPTPTPTPTPTSTPTPTPTSTPLPSPSPGE